MLDIEQLGATTRTAAARHPTWVTVLAARTMRGHVTAWAKRWQLGATLKKIRGPRRLKPACMRCGQTPPHQRTTNLAHLRQVISGGNGPATTTLLAMARGHVWTATSNLHPRATVSATGAMSGCATSARTDVKDAADCSVNFTTGITTA